MKPLQPTPPTTATAPPVRRRLQPGWPALALLLALISPPAWPHGGEDHGDARAPATPAQQAPRATAQTDSFELVAVLNQGNAPQPPTLTIYLDKVDTNEPVAQASIEVESGAFKASAQPVAPGVYSVPAAALAKPGRYPLTFTVQSADNADLLDATLVTATHEATAGHEAQAGAPAGPRSRWPWLAAGAAVLIAAAWLGRRMLARQRTPAGTPAKDSGRHAA